MAGVLLCAAGCQSSKETVVAKIGGEKITLSDLKIRLQEAPSAYQQYVASADGRRQFLNLMIREKAVLIQGRKAGLNHNADYQKSLAQFKKKWLRELKDYQESLLIEMELSHLRAQDLAISDTDVQQAYQQHRDQYDHPVEISVSHILLNSQAEAEKALARLKKGDRFEIVAREMSVDPVSAARGGTLAPFQQGHLIPEFEAAALPLAKGQVSGIVKTSFGYHLIKKLAQRSMPVRSFDDVKEEIRARLQRDRFDQWVTRTEALLGVKIDETAMTGLSLNASAASQTPGPHEGLP